MFNNSPFASPIKSRPSYVVDQPPVSLPKVKPQGLNLPMILSYYADFGGCGFWRMGWPDYILNMQGKAYCHGLMKMIREPSFYEHITAVRLQRQSSPSQLEFITFLKSIQPKYGFKLIYEIDDITIYKDIPDYNKFKPAFAPPEIQQSIIQMINLVDEVTVTCEFMRDYFRAETGQEKITVIPNFPPKFWIGNFYNHTEICRNFDNNKKKPRIVYAGSGCHFDVQNLTGGKDDFENVNDFIIATLDKYQWVFLGAYPLRLLPYIKSKQIEFHPWVNLLEYPAKLHSLKAQLFIAPLQDNVFNKAKSDIKWVEAAALGLPCICQDMVTYQNAPFKFKDANDLANKIEYVLNPARYKTLGPKLYKLAQSRFLENENNIKRHLEILTTPYNSPDRQVYEKIT